MTAFAIMLSFASFAVAPITGSSVICTGITTALADATPGGSWVSNDSTVAEVSSGGTVTGVSTGTTSIFYIVGADTATLSFTVNAAPVAIAGGTTVCTGSTISLTETTPGGTWISGNTALATVDASGTVSAIGTGVLNIYYSMGSTLSGCVAYHTVTVSATPSLSGPSSVCVGQIIDLAAYPAGGTWSAGSTGIATVGLSGLVTGVSAGLTNIYYFKNGCSAYHSVSVNVIPAISGDSVVCTGATITLSGTPTGGTWSDGGWSFASVSTAGVVLGRAPGVINIYYTAGGCYSHKPITVNITPVITGGTTVCTGSTISLTAYPPGGSWSSGNTGIATVSTSGIVTGLSAGVTDIYYSNGSCTAYHTVTVNGAAAAISGSSAICIGSTITLTDATTGGYWISGNTLLATVSSAGVVTGVAAGVLNIYYTMGTTLSGCTAEHTVTVSAAAAISGASTVCTGSTISLTGTPTGGTWSVGVSGIATVSTGGIVTGVTVGVTNVYYSRGGCFAYHYVTVNAAAAISGASAICAGSTISLTGTPTGGTWSVGGSSIATVTPAGIVTGEAAGVANIYYLNGGCYAYHTVTVNGAAAISGASSLCTGSTIALTATPSGGTWSVGSSSTATVSSGGIVTGLSSGVTNIYYFNGVCYAYHTVSVNGAPATISGSSTICIGSTTTLTDATTGGYWFSGNTAMATVSSGGVVTGMATGLLNIYYTMGSTLSGCIAEHTITVSAASAISGSSTVCTGSTITLTGTPTGGTWSVGVSGIATVSTGGIVTGVTAGVTNVYYSGGGCFAYHYVTVNAAAAISGASAVCGGSTISLTGTPSGGTWSVGGSSIATVSSVGVVTGVAAGVTNIYYLNGGCYAYQTVTVNAAAAISGVAALCTGSTISLTGSPAGGTWSVGSSTTATVSSGGVVTGLSAGVTNVYYFNGGCYAYHYVTVNTAPAPISGSSAICIGSTITLTDAITGGSWFSGNTALATVSSGGVVTGVAAGLLNIYYTMGTTLSGCTMEHTVTVNAAASISGASALCTGTAIALTGTPTGGTWSVGVSGIATVSSAGIVTGVTAGVTNIYYSRGGCFAYHYVTVSPAPAAIAGAASVCSGTSITLTDSIPGGTWVSGNTGLATVSTTGIVTGTGTGILNIYYTMGTSLSGCTVYHTLTVNATPTLSGPSVVCAGSAIDLAAIPAGGTWSSGNTGLATVSTGAVTGLSAGVTNIYYLIGGCYAYHTISVNAIPAISGDSAVCTGSTITLTGTPVGGTWSNGGYSFASVTTAGVVTGDAPGVIDIYYTVGSCYSHQSITVNITPAITGDASVCTGSTISLTAYPTGGSWSTGSTGAATVGTSGVVSELSAGVTNIYYSEGGCSAYHNLTVNATPVISGSSTVCASLTIALTSTITGGTWTGGGASIAFVATSGVVTGLEAGITNVYYSVLGCYAYQTVTVNASTISISGAASVGTGDSITLSSTTTGGTWYTGDSALATVSAAGVVTGVATGVLDIYYSTTGCPAYHGITVYEDSHRMSGNGTTGGTTSISVYPNPAKNNLNIVWTAPEAGTATIAIADMTGREVYRSFITIDPSTTQSQIDVDGLKDGIYLISIHDGHESFNAKIVIEK